MTRSRYTSRGAGNGCRDMRETLASRRPSGLAPHDGRSTGAGLEYATNACPESLWPFGPRGFESLSRRQTLRVDSSTGNSQKQSNRMDRQTVILMPHTLDDLTRLVAKHNFCILATQGASRPPPRGGRLLCPRVGLVHSDEH